MPLISLSFFPVVSEGNTTLPFDTLPQSTHDIYLDSRVIFFPTGGASHRPLNSRLFFQTSPLTFQTFLNLFLVNKWLQYINASASSS